MSQGNIGNKYLLKSGFHYLKTKDEFLKLGLFEWKVDFENLT